MPLEIEKKFLLKPFNVKNYLEQNSFDYKVYNIEQYYIEEEKRVRKFGKKYFLTVKRGEGLVREEIEKEINKDEFEKLLEDAKEKFSLLKRRFRVDIKGKIYEIDEFKKDLEGLIFLEVEFKNEKEAKSFDLDKRFKNFLLKEVTNDKRFSNFYIAKTKYIPSLLECSDIVNIDEIKPLCSTKDALSTILHSQFRSALNYKKKILNGDEDPENLHQFRVSLRKTRALLKEFKPYFKQNWYQNTYPKIKNLMTPTNKNRDIDVLLLNFDDYALKMPPSLREHLNEFKDLLLSLQKEEEKKVVELLKKDMFDEIKNSINNIEFNKNADFPIIITSYKAIKKRKNKIFKMAKKITIKSPAHEYHLLRIEFKKMRYLLEFFAHLFDFKETKEFIKNSKKIQDILGRHQDLEVQRNDIKNFIKNKNLSLDALLAIGKLIADMEFEEAYQRKKFKKVYKKLSKRLMKSIIF